MFLFLYIYWRIKLRTVLGRGYTYADLQNKKGDAELNVKEKSGLQ